MSLFWKGKVGEGRGKDQKPHVNIHANSKNEFYNGMLCTKGKVPQILKFFRIFQFDSGN